MVEVVVKAMAVAAVEVDYMVEFGGKVEAEVNKQGRGNMSALTLVKSEAKTRTQHLQVVDNFLAKILANAEEGYRNHMCSFSYLDHVRAAKESAEKLKGVV